MPNLLRDIIEAETERKVPVTASKAVLSIKRKRKTKPTPKTSAAGYPAALRDALKTIVSALERNRPGLIFPPPSQKKIIIIKIIK